MESDSDTEVVEYRHICFHTWNYGGYSQKLNAFPLFDAMWSTHKRVNDEGQQYACPLCRVRVIQFREAWCFWGLSPWAENTKNYDIFNIT